MSVDMLHGIFAFVQWDYAGMFFNTMQFTITAVTHTQVITLQYCYTKNIHLNTITLYKCNR